jgi:hypothetical protein
VWDIETGPLDESTVRRRVSLRAKSVTLKTDKERAEAILGWIELAALEPETGQVVAIGYGHSDGRRVIMGVDDSLPEASVLKDFWERWMANTCEWIGFNTAAFDLPFVIRRSWYLGVQVPPEVYPDRYGKWPPEFVDIAQHWALKQYGRKISLDLLAHSLGIQGKNGEGKDFARLWVEDRQRAYDYLMNDLRMTWEVGRRLGVIGG